MNSIIFDDLNRENLALESANNLKKLLASTDSVAELQKELLEINLSITAYIQESQKQLQTLKRDLALKAKSSSEKTKMSNLKTTPQKRNALKRNMSTCLNEDNNNSTKYSERLQARNFVSWFRGLIDNERQNFILYLADNVTLEWFGRTIRSRKKVAAFLKYDMHCSRHDFRSVECIDSIQSRSDRFSRRSILSDTSSLASPLHSPELIKTGAKWPTHPKCLSPEWEANASPERKRIKRNNTQPISTNKDENEISQRIEDITSKGDCFHLRQSKRKCLLVTPPNREIGQGDCLPSTSDNIIPTYPSPQKKYVECIGYIEFIRTRNSRSMDSVKWERKCKVQISYSQDPVNMGEYILWSIHYTDETKCRRNLLAAFEEVALQEKK